MKNFISKGDEIVMILNTLWVYYFYSYKKRVEINFEPINRKESCNETVCVIREEVTFQSPNECFNLLQLSGLFGLRQYELVSARVDDEWQSTLKKLNTVWNILITVEHTMLHVLRDWTRFRKCFLLHNKRKIFFRVGSLSASLSLSHPGKTLTGISLIGLMMIVQ